MGANDDDREARQELWRQHLQNFNKRESAALNVIKKESAGRGERSPRVRPDTTRNPRTRG